MALTTRDQLIQAVASGRVVPIYKGSMANQAAGYITSLWRATGNYTWGQGAIPGAAATCDDTLQGGIVLPSFGTAKGYVVRFNPIGATINSWLLFDRLAHMGGLSGTVITPTAQTVNVTLTTAASQGRCAADGSNVDWFIEIYTDVGTTASNATITYTDQTDTSRTVILTGLFGASPLNRAGRCVQIIPNSGQTIKSIVDVTLSASTGTAGSFGVTARRKLTSLGQMLANIAPVGVDAISIGAPEIRETSCLELLAQCSTTSTGVVQGDLQIGVV